MLYIILGICIETALNTTLTCEGTFSIQKVNLN